MSRIFKFLVPKALRKRIRSVCRRINNNAETNDQFNGLGPIDPKDFENLNDDDAYAKLATEVFKRMPAKDLCELFSDHNDIGLWMWGYGPPRGMASLRRRRPKTPPVLIDPNHPALVPDPEGRCFVNELPAEMLDTIFSYIKARDRETLKDVCRLWYARLTPNRILWIDTDTEEN